MNFSSQHLQGLLCKRQRLQQNDFAAIFEANPISMAPGKSPVPSLLAKMQNVLPSSVDLKLGCELHSLMIIEALIFERAQPNLIKSRGIIDAVNSRVIS